MGSKLEDEKKDPEKAEISHNEDIVESSIGVLGPWHIRLCILIAFVKFPIAWHQLSYSFLAPEVQFTCVDNTTEKCSPNCTEHVFDRSVFTETIITQWDLVCGKSFLAALSQTVTMAGILVGNMLFGYLSDRFGRRNPLIWAVIIQGITGILTAFVPWFTLFIIMRFLLACATGGTMVTSFVLIMESIGIRWRTTIGILYQIPFNLGHLSLPLISYFIRDWRWFQTAISIPSFFLITYYFFLPESPRYLLTSKQSTLAVQVMTEAACKNNLLTDHIKPKVDIFVKNLEEKSSNEDKRGRFVDLFLTPHMRLNSACIFFNWLVCGLCFFGVAYYIGSLGGNIFINVAVNSVTQIPGTIFTIWCIKAWGRQYTLIASNILIGVALLGVAIIPEASTTARTGLSAIAMFGLAVAFPTVYIYSGELFPTIVRNVGVGMGSVWARVGSMTAPHVVAVGGWVPPVIFGVVPLVGAALAWWLPETLDCRLKDTVGELEEWCEGEVKLKSKEERLED